MSLLAIVGAPIGSLGLVALISLARSRRRPEQAPRAVVCEMIERRTLAPDAQRCGAGWAPALSVIECGEFEGRWIGGDLYGDPDIARELAQDIAREIRRGDLILSLVGDDWTIAPSASLVARIDALGVEPEIERVRRQIGSLPRFMGEG